MKRICVIAIIFKIVSSADYKLQVTRITCEEVNLKYIEQISCKRLAFNRTTDLLSADITLKPTIVVDDITIRLILYYKFGVVYKQFLIDKVEDICGFLTGNNSSPLIGLVYNEIKRNGNMNHPCPYSGNIYVRNATYQESLQKFPPFLPEGDYRIEGIVHAKIDQQNPIYFGKLIIHATIKPTGAKKLAMG